MNGAAATVEHIRCCNGQHWTVFWYDAGSNVSYVMSVDLELAAQYGTEITPSNASSAVKLVDIASSLRLA